MNPRRDYGPLCAEFYDRTKPIGVTYPDVMYYLNELRSTAGPILEAAVGTGRLLIPLLESGLVVEGIDASEDMLAYCRRHCEERGLAPRLRCARIETLELPDRYDAILLAFGSMMLLSTQEAMDALKVLRCHLRPGGSLYLDLDVPRIPEHADGTVRLLRRIDCSNGDVLTLYSATRYDMIRHLEHNQLRYEKSSNGKVVAEELQDFILRWYGMDEMTLMLRVAGFENIESCADFEPGKDPVLAREWLCFRAKNPSFLP